VKSLQESGSINKEETHLLKVVSNTVKVWPEMYAEVTRLKGK